MKTLNSTKQILYLAFIIVSMSNVQSLHAEEELAPDQNPNYKRSMEKYMAIKDELIKNEGTTVQNTYKAIDDVQLKKEKKELRKTRRQERRLARINNRGYYYTPYYGYNNYSYPYSYGYNNYYGNGINYSCFNTGYNSYNGYGHYHNRYHHGNYGYRPSYGINAATNLALLGLGTSLLFR